MKKILFGFLVSLLLSFGTANALEIGLKWNPNTESDLAGYNVYQSNVTGGPYVLVETVKANPSPSYTWPVPPGTERTHYWVVSAIDTSGNESGYSNEVSVYVDNKPPMVPGGVQIIVIVVPK